MMIILPHCTDTSLSRIRAALGLRVVPGAAAGLWDVGRGQTHRPRKAPWSVDTRDAEPRCQCPDHLGGKHTCKHIIAVLLHVAGPDVQADVARRVAECERRMAAAG